MFERRYNFDVIRKKIIKDKKLSVNDKYQKLIENYDFYYKYKWYDDANLETFELDYERFMLENGQKNARAYNKCFFYNLNNIALVRASELIKDVDKLKEQGLDEDVIDKQLLNTMSEIKKDLSVFDGNLSKNQELVNKAKHIITIISSYNPEDELIYD